MEIRLGLKCRMSNQVYKKKKENGPTFFTDLEIMEGKSLKGQ